MLSKQIVITGPESSGKSTLAAALATRYNRPLIKEYAREYLSNINRPYVLDDVLMMAKEQLRREMETQHQFVFLDTDLTVFCIWIKEKYQLEIPWINKHLKQASDKIYLLCAADIEWESDALREHPKKEDRQRLFQLYQKLLEQHHYTYHIISGTVINRVKQCETIFQNNK